MIWGYMLECSSSNSCKETRIKIILRIYTTAEKPSKINNVAAPSCLEKKKLKNPTVLCRHYRCAWHGSSHSNVDKQANMLNMSSSGRKIWTATQTSRTTEAGFLVFLNGFVYSEAGLASENPIFFQDLTLFLFRKGYWSSRLPCMTLSDFLSCSSLGIEFNLA